MSTHIQLIIQDNKLVYQTRNASDITAAWQHFSSELIVKYPALHHLPCFDFVNFIQAFLGGSIDDDPRGPLPAIDTFRYELNEYASGDYAQKLAEQPIVTGGLKNLFDKPIMRITDSIIELAINATDVNYRYLFSPLARHEICRFFNALQARKIKGVDVTGLADVVYMEDFVRISLKERAEKPTSSTVSQTPNSSWMAGMHDAISTVEAFAVIDGEGVETFKKNLLIRMNDMLKPTYITPAKYEPDQIRQMVDTLTSIYIRLGNAGVKAIDSHAISLIIAECEYALPGLTKGPAW